MNVQALIADVPGSRRGYDDRTALVPAARFCGERGERPQVRFEGGLLAVSNELAHAAFLTSRADLDDAYVVGALAQIVLECQLALHDLNGEIIERYRTLAPEGSS